MRSTSSDEVCPWSCRPYAHVELNHIIPPHPPTQTHTSTKPCFKSPELQLPHSLKPSYLRSSFPSSYPIMSLACALSLKDEANKHTKTQEVEKKTVNRYPSLFPPILRVSSRSLLHLIKNKKIPGMNNAWYIFAAYPQFLFFHVLVHYQNIKRANKYQTRRCCI